MVFSKIMLQLVLAVMGLLAYSCNYGQSSAKKSDAGEPVIVRVNATEKKHLISPLVMGFNTIYCYEPDAYWKNGEGVIPKYLKDINAGILRYPGGTVVNRFDWENPTGQGWKELDDPDFNPAKNLDATGFLSVGEYLNASKKIGSAPLIGINMSTGVKYKKEEEYLEKAKKLVRYCKDHYGTVKYYYLDNEPYMKSASYPFSASDYAAQINKYAAAIKSIDPDIKIIANTHPGNLQYTDSLLNLARNNIDLVDIHYYWHHGRATFENWVKQPVMLRGNQQGNLGEQRQKIIEIGKKYGSNVDMVVLEWSVGPEGNGLASKERRTLSQVALMISEQYMDILDSGIPMACYWPVSWPGKMDRVLLDGARGYQPTTLYYALDLFKPVLNANLVTTNTSEERIRTMAFISSDHSKLWIYLINKTKTTGASDINLVISNGNSISKVEMVLFDITDNKSGALNTGVEHASLVNGKLKIRMPQYSLARLEIQIK